MTRVGDQPDKMTEVAGLAAAIADRILEQHEAAMEIPPEQFRMLVRAARMLLDNDVPWPSSVEQVIMEVAQRVEDAKASASELSAGPGGDDVVMRLTQSLTGRPQS
ncbi:hypothetical protein ACLBX9_07325 [Methylobacterium sp. A49B]|uniref:Uncharacterized protein n=1 Tax=Methylobacterium mesophilicum SR1.6/6 TaxID=908290 RepID=A0A6B9FJ36_9HYPH|nr:hypothetical protein [Methylobacterium mesophilicum]MBE7196518.1 hypothetical protein [Parafilimonas terrae]QGY02012.1 hypothetical protein MMSR116_09055 [Methylobacterium mesophilicum SR1.6/6]